MNPLRIFLVLFFVCAAMVFPAKTVMLENIRYYAYPEYTRVVLDLSRDVRIQEKVLKNAQGGRVFFDLPDSVFAPEYPAEKRKEIRIASGNLQGIRVGQFNARTVRVVFDFDRIGRYQRFYLSSPFRIVFDIFKGDEPASGRPSGTQPAGGTPSIARQLGLGVRRIVIDPGHGGKDPGTVNRELNLEEKEITLDIARRLQSMLKEHPDFEILLTRDQDVFLPLEERTAIANSRNGDLFISIHVNSAPRKTARGIETYFLSLTTDPWAMNVAAQENAVSTHSIGEMRTILDRIIRNSNISESKILAESLQRQLVGRLQKKYREITDLGVKKAPFYVLVGARMPSTLVETSFLSSRPEATRLADPAYRHSVAAGLYFGVTGFIRSLGKR